MLYNLFVNKWYFDKIYSVIFVKPTMSLAHNISKFDKLVVDGMVTTASNLTHLASQASSLFDRSVVDGMVNSLANLVMNTGEKSRQLQTGKLRQYLAVLAVGVVGLFGWLYIWIQS
jgi:NADH:ubiquinone oxidoreductase subunit 5 (subunit L)/multisubunit Na+/H+ antiporter MnhA subunit